PFSLYSGASGIKDISLVVSNSEYLAALVKQFCSEPKKTAKASGVVPRSIDAKGDNVLSARRQTKKATVVKNKTSGVISAVFVQPSLRIMPTMTSAAVVDMMPIVEVRLFM